jgi:glycosyltransferase involved in cell wall biosynthesis
MNILIDGNSMVRRPTGVGHYARHLLGRLVEMNGDDRFSLFAFLFFGRRTFGEPFTQAPNVSYRYIRYLPGRVYNLLLRLGLPLPVDLLTWTKPDLVIYPNFVRLPLLSKARTITVVHDLCFRVHPEFVDGRHLKRILPREIPRTLRNSTRIVTVSESTKRELVRHYGIQPEGITVITPSVDHGVYKPAGADEVDRVREKFGIAKEYLLFVGSLDPRKNVSGLLEAFGGLPHQFKSTYQMVLAGPRGSLTYPERDRLIENAPTTVITTGYVDERDKVALYSGTSLFVYPSHYEGWGMPILEAMACGAPVLTARNTSLPEAGGDAAAYVEDSRDIGELTRLIVELLDDPLRRKEMGEAGRKRAAAFSWDMSTQRLAELIDGLAVSESPRV